ncbi:NAD(P)/FAD-dependent oxidoreductase [Haliangium sp.]|uniref:NAD(P)/FAD-dependent oxidoreductase n=1 Tax=Haliangium sp. TaxID=2663208 RepID=UPI003D12E6B5
MNQTPHVRECDTLIIGASMAGGCLARQLKLAHPDMDIVVLDKKHRFDHWVGESTLESFWDYAARHLELGHYLDTKHVYKHGLRFFYDSPEHDLPIDQMSEVGRSWFHSTPAHQLDRVRFDNDLLAMNRASGVDVRMGVAVREVEIDRDNGHRITASDGVTYRCRWVVDAAGFAAPVGRALGLIESNDDDHPISSYWGRFKNVADMDLLGDKDWRARTSYVTRSLATTHFMYGGYWIWMIPIDADTYSIGVTTKNDMVDIEIKSQEEFVAFLRTHRCMQQLLGEAELLDYRQMKRLSRRAKRFFSEDGWFLTGMSAAFLDPILSPGSAWLADANRMIGELIATDRAGDEQAFRTQVKAFNIYADFWLDNFFLHIKGQYHDCYDRQRVYFEQLLMQWFGIILPNSMIENWGYTPGMTDEDIATLEARTKMMMENNSIAKIDHLIEEFHDFLKARGVEHDNNRGQFFDIEIGEANMHNTRTRGRDLCPEGIMKIENEMIFVTIRHALRRMAEIEGLRCDQPQLDQVSRVATDDHLTLTQALGLLATSPSQALVA